jgi:hypothetical protein
VTEVNKGSQFLQKNWEEEEENGEEREGEKERE